jgi:hypothetical protein
MNIAKAWGEPPWLASAFKSDAKYWFQIQVVGQYLWAEVACWRTDKGAQRGWSLSSHRLLTPLFGLAYWVSFKESP